MACCYLYLHSIGNVLVMLIPTDLSIPKFLLRSDAERKEMDDKRANEKPCSIPDVTLAEPGDGNSGSKNKSKSKSRFKAAT